LIDKRHIEGYKHIKLEIYIWGIYTIKMITEKEEYFQVITMLSLFFSILKKNCCHINEHGLTCKEKLRKSNNT